MRIEVGYGLEPVLTDAFSSVVINQQILPRFKAGDIPGGIVAGTNAVADQLALSDAEARAKVTAAAAEYDKTHARKNSGGGVPIGLIFFGIVLAAIVIPMLSRRAGGKHYVAGGSRGGGSGALPIVLWSIADAMTRGGGGGGGGSWGGGGDSGGGWGGGGFGGGGGGSGGGGGASGSW